MSRLWTCLLIVVLLGTACSSTDDDASGDRSTTTQSTVASGPTNITTAIERAAGYFDTRPPRGDVGFVLGQASMRLSPGFRAWAEALEPDPAVTEAMKDPEKLQYIEALLWNGRLDAHEPWQPLPQPSVAPAKNPTTLSDDELRGVTDVMSAGLRCGELTPELRQAWLTSLATPARSYLLTHQLLSLTWARHHGCLTDAEADPLRERLATAVYAELLADGNEVNDLTLERMAMLCYADLCDWVTDAQTGAVVAAQHPDGSWGDGSVPINDAAFVPPEHTAGLGFYVLGMKWDDSSPAPTPPG